MQINAWLSKKRFYWSSTYLIKEVCLVDLSGQLSMEQQFKLKVLHEQVQGLSKEQAQEYLLEMFRQMMVKDNLVKNLLKNA